MELIQAEAYGQYKQVVQGLRELLALSEKNGLALEAQMLAERLEKLENDGIFNVLFIGPFNTGKSTLINALAESHVLPTAPVVCTPIITVLDLEDSTNGAEIFYDDQTSRSITLQQFKEEFSHRAYDEDQAVNSFFNIDYVKVHSSEVLHQNGLRFIDSRGIDIRCHNKDTGRYISKADAIIFVLDAISLFSAEEKEYIRENLAAKQMRNVFFVVNRINFLPPGVLEASVIPYVRRNLEDVFHDDAGNFDEELYKKRVFFVDALGALRVRTNEPYKIFNGKKEVVVPMALEDTGIENFEAALQEFLNSGDRIQAHLCPALSQMDQVCVTADKRYEEYKESITKRADEYCKRRMDLDVILDKQKLDEIDAELAAGEVALSRYREHVGRMHKIADKVYEALYGCNPNRRFARRGSVT